MTFSISRKLHLTHGVAETNLGNGRSALPTKSPLHASEDFFDAFAAPKLESSTPPTEPIREKYDTEKVLNYLFSSHSALQDLHQAYHHISGEPGFMIDVVAMRSTQIRPYLEQRSELVKWNDAGNFILFPSRKYVDQEALIRDPKSARLDPSGLGLHGWYVHPVRLATSLFADPEVRKGGAALREALKQTEKAASENTQSPDGAIEALETPDSPFISTSMRRTLNG
jgi:hypothetical protein